MVNILYWRASCNGSYHCTMANMITIIIIPPSSNNFSITMGSINLSMATCDELDAKYDISIASLNAELKGISVVCCAGNEDKDKFHRHIMNLAPWVITVAAGTKLSSSSTNNRSLVDVNQPHGGSLRPGHGFKGLHMDPKIPSSPTAAAESKVKSPRVPPKVAWFSLRGPNRHFQAVLKPDIAAPGVKIPAAELSQYNLTTGTSTSTAYISGLVAIIKSQHPYWPPSAIKSAITATGHNYSIVHLSMNLWS
ncbi:subtilisin-like protein protease SBT1.6 [Cinnamomum micranthum f. kanehirae]|uniref:Subtilisin-like protein protease SBT1.6 n=1 Tax=Cinnamomum micranthum f. kanehirae TaxID=337451 RepID=A0A443NKU0_9MAGN|nr:subtilisin-like protein protease SBT1.6 [Cinnamomum micranthum f. kanehirae]